MIGIQIYNKIFEINSLFTLNGYSSYRRQTWTNNFRIGIEILDSEHLYFLNRLDKSFKYYMLTNIQPLLATTFVVLNFFIQLIAAGMVL
jgi:hypothetical protein